MKAVVLEKIGDSNEAFSVKEVDEPSALEEDEVLIEVEAFGLNFADF